MGESLVVQSRGARFFALAGLIVAVHLAALAVLLTTEYGPFAITLSVLAWVFVNCFLLVVLQRPAVCAALALTFIVILIALSPQAMVRRSSSTSPGAPEPFAGSQRSILMRAGSATVASSHQAPGNGDSP